MHIPPHIEAEDTTVQLVPASVLRQIMNHQIQSILQMTVSIRLDHVLMTVTFHLKDIVINHTEGDCYMRSIAMTKTTDFIINQGVCCCLKLEKNKSYVDIMPEVEDRDDTDFKATRKLRAVKNPPVTNMFEQECHLRPDNIKCMVKLLLSRTQTNPRTGLCNQPLNWKELFLYAKTQPITEIVSLSHNQWEV